MKLIKKYWKETLLVLLVGVLVYFFPLTNKDWVLYNKYESINLGSIKTLFNFNLLPVLIATILNKIKIIKIIFYTISFISLFYLIKNIISKKNSVLVLIGIFLFFLLKEDIIFTSFISPYGFCLNILPIIPILLIIYLVINDSLYKIPKIISLLLGLISCIFNLSYSIAVFLLLSIYFIYLLLKKEKDKNYTYLYIGALIVCTCMLIFNIVNKHIVTCNIAENILHGIIPIIYSMDFIISLILISFLLFVSIKVYMSNRGKKKVFTIFSLVSILLYSLARMLSTNDILNYIAFILFEASSVFILLNSNNKIQFKNIIKSFYILKWIYLIVLSFSNIDISSMLFLEIINIVIILTEVDYLFPKNYMLRVWFIISTLLIMLNIYTFRKAYVKTMEMNRFIKNHLECDVYKVYLPYKYYSSNKNFLLPHNKEERIEYSKFLKINLDNDYSIIIENEK